MDPVVSLKGVGDGLRLYIGSLLPKEQMLAEIAPLFDRMGRLASGARIAVDACGKEEDLLPVLKDFLIEKYKVADVFSVEDSLSRPLETRKRQREIDRSWENRKSDMVIMCGRVRSGQKIQQKGHVLLMGDVNPGGEVIAGGDIIVLGSLCGKAMAGQSDRPESLIVALDFRPTLIHIGELFCTGPFENTNRTPRYARIREERIAVMEYMADPPFSKLPWLENR